LGRQKKGGGVFKNLQIQGKRYRKRGASKDKRDQIFGRVAIDKHLVAVAEK
jgi:hypothetical protein